MPVARTHFALVDRGFHQRTVVEREDSLRTCDVGDEERHDTIEVLGHENHGLLVFRHDGGIEGLGRDGPFPFAASREARGAVPILHGLDEAAPGLPNPEADAALPKSEVGRVVIGRDVLRDVRRGCGEEWVSFNEPAGRGREQ